MKTPTTKLSKQRYRPIGRKLSMLVGVIGITVLGFTASVSASSLSPNISFSMFQHQDKKLFELDKLSTEKSKELLVVEKEVTATLEEAKVAKEVKVSTETELKQVQSEIERLASMFVKIDRYAGDSGGNGYALGNCTWYAKSVRPDISNSWGNANTWYSNAQAQGWNVGTSPKKGAVATTTAGGLGHVAYVIGVSKDESTVTIREMNYGGLYRMNTRTVPASDFRYIYELN